MDPLADLRSRPFLPAWAYGSSRLAGAERQRYANRFWHPLASASQLPPGSCLALTLLGQPILLSHPLDGPPQAFFNRCPHRGVALQDPAAGTVACRRLVCPYHGWTYGLDGVLLAGAREADFLARKHNCATWSIRLLFLGEGSLWILGSGVPSKAKRKSSPGALKLALLGPRERSSIFNVDLVVVAAAVQPRTGPGIGQQK